MNFVETMANLTLSDFSPLYDYEEDDRLMNVNLRELVQFVSVSCELEIGDDIIDTHVSSGWLIGTPIL